MIVRNYPMGTECRECGSPPPGHNASCTVSIRERNAEIERLRTALRKAKAFITIENLAPAALSSEVAARNEHRRRLMDEIDAALPPS